MGILPQRIFFCHDPTDKVQSAPKHFKVFPYPFFLALNLDKNEKKLLLKAFPTERLLFDAEATKNNIIHDCQTKFSCISILFYR